VVAPFDVIGADYTPFKYEFDEVSKEHYVAMRDASVNFLNVICGTSEYNLNVLRVFLRNILTVPYEGRNCLFVRIWGSRYFKIHLGGII
jgi:hypothetical protein